MEVQIHSWECVKCSALNEIALDACWKCGMDRKESVDLSLAAKALAEQEARTIELDRLAAKRLCDERAIMIACETGDKKALAAAIAVGANMNFVFPETGQTPLTACLMFDRYELVEPLIYKGRADVNLPNREGETPLHIICLANEEKLLSLKRHFGVRKWDAMVTILRNHPNVNAQDCHGRTPLHFAVICGERSYIRLLFGEFAKTDICDVDGLTPEQLMIARAKADIERFFYTRGDISSVI